MDGKPVCAGGGLAGRVGIVLFCPDRNTHGVRLETDWTRGGWEKGEDTDTGDQADRGRSNMFGVGGLLDTVYG